MPEEAREVYDVVGEDVTKRFRLSPQIAGVISAPAGAVHGYRLVASILSNCSSDTQTRKPPCLLPAAHLTPSSFRLRTQTPCTAIDAPSTSSPHYTLHTPAGTLTATHVIHATNGWSPHLLPGMSAKIPPVRGHMSAQRPGRALARPLRGLARRAPVRRRCRAGGHMILPEVGWMCGSALAYMILGVEDEMKVW
ncbi:hypothetical protein FA95DRAFT_1610372 [Auriscalpium vulgare]|uniref:Uncharacterized protein n=1 Tax=Auriscalpium vulgare TaxID=40419 RepID=A0ACB8RDD6_9AGAM|nr:hypothetical protein FA95DRAFT_1610372 [Auriscalpium vulgare]